MMHWHETARLLDALGRLLDAGRGAALATVVRISGSAYRRAGAKMLIPDQGPMSGSVSGGCLEADVREAALAVLRTGAPQLLHYDTGADEERTPWGLGLGCNGAVDIFVQPATPPARHVWEASAARLRGDTRFAVSTVIRGPVGVGSVLLVAADGRTTGSTGAAHLDRAIATRAHAVLAAGASQRDELEGAEIFTEVQVPPPHLLVLGAGADVRPLAHYATDAGFRVTVADHRPAFLDGGHYPPDTRLLPARPDDASAPLPLGPRTYAVVKAHSLTHDREWVRRLLASDVPYIGVLGPRARVEEILRQLGAESTDRVFGPVGLDLGAEGPEQIAMSIVAELLAVWSGRQPGHLREKEGVIHAE